MCDTSSLASWGCRMGTPVRQRSQSLAQSSPCAGDSTIASDSAIGFEDGLEIAAVNVDEWLYYDSYYKVLVCRYHGYAVRNLATHLRLQHKVRSSERSAIEKKFRACELLEPAQVSTPPSLQAPLDWLRSPMRGL
jgi:hypothetical protein